MRARRRLRGLAGWGRLWPRGDRSLLALLALVALGIEIGASPFRRLDGVLLQVAPVIAGGLLLARREMRPLLVVVAGCVGFEVWRTRDDMGAPGLSFVLVVAVTAALSYELARRRDRLGLPSRRADAMLVELRDRLRAQGELPALPSGWHVEATLRSAGGASFAGDFLVSALERRLGRDELELSLVDVSGKGVDAGTRALLLSGALGGLIGAVEPSRFLPEANRYLVRQQWNEGFATAVHLTVDLRTGDYVLESAGHPPAVHFDAGSGRWRIALAEGPLLGILDEVKYEAGTGRLRPGDALLLYTDGLVEVPGRDIDVGLDKLLGAAERLVPRGGFREGAERLVDEVARDAADDRALLLLWRT